MALDQNSISFQFMIKEYEMLYGKFQMHYEAVEKSINFYFILVGAVMSLSSFLSSPSANFSIFEFNGIQTLLLLIFSVLGILVLFKVVEHRILIIHYVKSLNLNRKWFSMNGGFPDLDKYFYWKASPKSPEFYKKYRHFYWESMALSTINALISGLLVINIIVKTGWFKSNSSIYYNTFFLVVLCIALIFPQMLYYKRRAKEEDLKLEQKINNNEIVA